MDRISVIHKSLLVFNCAIASLIPLVGILPAAFALSMSVRIHRRHYDWNPAARYLAWGDRLALLGILISGVTLLLIAICAISNHGASDLRVFGFDD